nr:MAG TPA: hypothetical protein [Caudoviricetes sp.]
MTEHVKIEIAAELMIPIREIILMRDMEHRFSFLIRKLIDKKVKCLMLLENWICMIEILSCRKR